MGNEIRDHNSMSKDDAVLLFAVFAITMTTIPIYSIAAGSLWKSKWYYNIMQSTGWFSFMLHPITQGIGWMIFHFFLSVSLFFYVRDFDNINAHPTGDFSWVLGWYIVIIVLNWVIPCVSAIFLSFVPTMLCVVCDVVAVVLIFVYEIQYTDGEGPKHLDKSQHSPIWLMIPVLVWIVLELIVCTVIFVYSDIEYEGGDDQKVADRQVYSKLLEKENPIAALPGNQVTTVYRNAAQTVEGHFHKNSDKNDPRRHATESNELQYNSGIKRY